MFGLNKDRVEEILSKTCSMIRCSASFRAWAARQKARRLKRMNSELVARVVPTRMKIRNVMKDRRYGKTGYLTRTLPIARIRQLVGG